VAQACTNTEHRSRASAVLRRVAAYTGVTLATVGLVTAFAAAPAEAADIDYGAASASEIEGHLSDLESERDDADADLADLQGRLEAAQAVVDAAAATYGTTDAQLTDVTAAVESAEDELGAKVSTLVAYAQEQSDRYTEAQEAAELSDRLEIRIAKTEAQVEDLEAQIEEAEEAYDEAAEAEAAAAAAAAEAEASAESNGGGSSSDDASSSSTASYSSDAATAAVEFARDQLGESYVFGAAGPDTWDCSGLVTGAYGVSGISLTHSTWAIWDETSSIGRGDLRPGDLVFYNGQNHMAIYIGDGQVIHAPKPGDVVKTSDLDMGMSIDGYRRV
jgi:peptidoglycan DL-endopeptidase CwlO